MKDECQALQPEAVIAQAENATDLLSRLNNDLVATDRALASANATLAAHEAAGLAESLGEIESDLSLKRLEWSSLSRRAEAAKKLFEILADCRDKATWSYRAPLKAKAALSDCARRSRVLVSPESGVPVIFGRCIGPQRPRTPRGSRCSHSRSRRTSALSDHSDDLLS